MANSALISGAYDTSKYHGAEKDEVTKELGENLNDFITSSSDEEGKSRKKEEEKEKEKGRWDNPDVDAGASRVVDTGGAFSNEDYNIASELQAARSLEFATAPKLKQASIMADLNKDAGLIAGYKENKIRLAGNLQNKSVIGGVTTPGGFGLALESDPKAKAFMGRMVTDPTTLTTRDRLNGEGKELGVRGPDDEFMSYEEFESYVASFEVDDTSFNAISDLTNSARDMASKADPEDVFDDMAKDTVRQSIDSIIRNGNIKSLVNDPAFGGTSFIEDLKNSDMMNNIRYSDLGIKPKGNDDFISEDDGLSEEDKETIVSKLVDDPDSEDVLMDTLKDYFVKHVERNYVAEHNKVIRKFGKDNFDKTREEFNSRINTQEINTDYL
jgi:hypothetical protein